MQCHRVATACAMHGLRSASPSDSEAHGLRTLHPDTAPLSATVWAEVNHVFNTVKSFITTQFIILVIFGWHQLANNFQDRLTHILYIMLNPAAWGQFDIVYFIWWLMCAISYNRVFGAKRRHAKTRHMVTFSCFRMATFRPATRNYATFHELRFRLLFVVSLPGGAKGRHAKTRQNHHLAGFRVATFRVFAPKTRLYEMAQISHHNFMTTMWHAYFLQTACKPWFTIFKW